MAATVEVPAYSEPTPVVPTAKGTLTFDLGGGTIDGKTTLTIEANVGDVITIPQAPVRDGYTFKYWKGSEYYPGDEYTIEGGHAFTAVWEKKSNGGVSVGGGSSTGGGASTNNASSAGAGSVTRWTTSSSASTSARGSLPDTGDSRGEVAALAFIACSVALCPVAFVVCQRRRLTAVGRDEDSVDSTLF